MRSSTPSPPTDPRIAEIRQALNAISLCDRISQADPFVSAALAALVAVEAELREADKTGTGLAGDPELYLLAVEEGQKAIELARDAEARVGVLEEALRRAAHIAQSLHGMIDRQTWRDSGGDDQQGHYEGDYWAETTLTEIEGWRALAAASEEANEPPAGMCPHGRRSWRSCPHCLGVNTAPGSFASPPGEPPQKDLGGDPFGSRPSGGETL